MEDTLLTSLCSICHVSKPQYRCPRCSIRTCSLACVKKHKAWSQCSGERDPTVYVPRSRLRTAAGVDHDYNFLHGIELAAERAERLLVSERGVVRTEELRPLTAQEVRWKTGRDGKRRRVLVTRVLREARGRVIEKNLATRLAKLNIEIVCAPTGMTRQRENHTTLNRRTGRINWQVEWFSLRKSTDHEQKPEDEGRKSDFTRVLSKVMDDVPLYQAYHAILEDQHKTPVRPGKKTIRPTAQNFVDSKWQWTVDSLQDPSDATWVAVSGTASLDAWPEEKEDTQRRAFQFFLSRQRTQSDQSSVTVTRIDAGEVLRDVLPNTRVLEFPTIYVLQKDEALPPGFSLGPKDFTQPRPSKELLKRRSDERPNGNADRPAKRRRPGTNQDEVNKKKVEDEDEGEEGECGSGRDQDGDSHGEDHGEDGEHHRFKDSSALEAGEVIAEQELMEEEDVVDDEDDDDMTSSSGSDSET